jgi:hypothetical protein
MWHDPAKRGWHKAISPMQAGSRHRAPWLVRQRRRENGKYAVVELLRYCFRHAQGRAGVLTQKASAQARWRGQPI